MTWNKVCADGLVNRRSKLYGGTWRRLYIPASEKSGLFPTGGMNSASLEALYMMNRFVSVTETRLSVRIVLSGFQAEDRNIESLGWGSSPIKRFGEDALGTRT